MPPLESLGPDSDYSGFLSRGVSEALRRKALARLFRSPAYNVVDGLDDYAEDFTKFAPLGDIVTADMRHQLEQRLKRLADAESDTRPRPRQTRARASTTQTRPRGSVRSTATAPNNQIRPSIQTRQNIRSKIVPEQHRRLSSTRPRRASARRRHHMSAPASQQTPTPPVQRPSLDSPLPTRADASANRAARAHALEALAASPVQATGLIEYHAGNRLLVVGDDPVLVERAVRAAGTALQASALVILAADDAWRAPIAGVTTWYVTRADVDLHGWLGGFRLRLPSQGDGEARFDQVLDLCAAPLLGTELPPPGYLSADETDIEDRIETLADLIGQFEKPKYFRYNADICAHGMKGATACTRCIDACPAGAITSLVERVRVEPHLCQGGGACATACPTGAMTYSYPSVEDSLERVRRMLRAYHDAGGEAPLLLIHDNEGGADRAQALLAADDEARKSPAAAGRRGGREPGAGGLAHGTGLRGERRVADGPPWNSARLPRRDR